MAEPAVTDDDDYALQRQLAIVDVVTPTSNSNSSAIIPFSPPFSLPDGWFVRKVLRSDGLRYDKYYIESETGRKFRSRVEVKRYLNVEEFKATRSRPLRLEYKIKNSSDREMNTSEANFYHDPESGRKFRSLKGVERYLTDGCTPSRRSGSKRLKYYRKRLHNRVSRKKIVSGGKMLDFEEDNYNPYQLVNVTPTSFLSTSPFKLPDGWIVQEVPRKNGGHVDRYYYEPGTGRKFRSLTAAQQHLAELEENSPLSVVLEELRENNLPLSKAFKLRASVKNHRSWKKSISRKEQDSPPSKINWVISNRGDESWNAFLGDTVVSDTLKQQWGKRFMSAINNNNKHNSPISGFCS